MFRFLFYLQHMTIYEKNTMSVLYFVWGRCIRFGFFSDMWPFTRRPLMLDFWHKFNLKKAPYAAAINQHKCNMVDVIINQTDRICIRHKQHISHRHRRVVDNNKKELIQSAEGRYEQVSTRLLNHGTAFCPKSLTLRFLPRHRINQLDTFVRGGTNKVNKQGGVTMAKPARSNKRKAKTSDGVGKSIHDMS